MPDGTKPGPGGWNRIHFVVDDLAFEVECLRNAGFEFRNDIVTGPGGSEISSNVVDGVMVRRRRPRGWVGRFGSFLVVDRR